MRIADVAGELLGPRVLLNQPSEDVPDGPRWYNRVVSSRQYTIAGGTSEIQRNIIGERVLGSPKDDPPTTPGRRHHMSVKFDISAPYDVEETDVAFARPEGMELLARVYRPVGQATGLLPVVVDVHGGAWTRLDRTTGVVLGRGLASCGVVVVALDFRMGPVHKHPAASADVAAGVRWVRAHADRLGVDRTRLGIAGSSSGGHLASLLAVTPKATFHDGTPIIMPDGSLDATSGELGVAFAMVAYPVCDPLARYRYVLSRKDEPPQPNGFSAQRLIDAHPGFFRDEAHMAEMSVTRIVASGEAGALPPMWLGQPDTDDNVPAAITDAFVQAYQRAGGTIERSYFPGASTASCRARADRQIRAWR